MPPAASQAAVTVNPAAVRQRMSGFGGIATPTAYAELGAAGKCVEVFLDNWLYPDDELALGPRPPTPGPARR